LKDKWEIGAVPDKQVILMLDGASPHVAKDLEVPEYRADVPAGLFAQTQLVDHLWPLVDEALVNMHFEILGDLDGAPAQRCRILANDPDQIRVSIPPPLEMLLAKSETTLRLRLY
jgi:hypothetical protein